MKKFKDLAIGETFHTGKSKGAGMFSPVVCFSELKKTSPKEATLVKQHGVQGSRKAGDVSMFPWNAPTWSVML